MIRDSLSSFPAFAEYFAAGLVFLIAYLGLYTLVSSLNEIRLIRQGNVAAAASFTGATLGFTVPLYAVITHSRSLTDMAVWSLIILAVQLFIYFVARRVVPGIETSIEKGNAADGLFLAALSVATGVIAAACLVP